MTAPDRFSIEEMDVSLCNSHADDAQAAAAAPRLAQGAAVDPIALQPVDEVVVTTLVDNVFDALLSPDARTSRSSFGVGHATAQQFESGTTNVDLRAEASGAGTASRLLTRTVC